MAAATIAVAVSILMLKFVVFIIIIVVQHSHVNKYYIMIAKIKLWTLSMWHIMSLMRCIISLNNIKWKMYTQNRCEPEQKCKCNGNILSTTMCIEMCVHSFPFSLCVCVCLCVYFPKPTRDFDAVFNKHYTGHVCVCVWVSKAFSFQHWNTSFESKYPLGWIWSLRVCMCAMQIYPIIFNYTL